MKKVLAISFIFIGAQSNAQENCNPYSIYDFMYPCRELDEKVEEVFKYMKEEERVGQMIMPAAGRFGKSVPYVTNLIKEKKAGGVILLVGTKDEFKTTTHSFDSLTMVGHGVPLMFSADAELSLINMKIKGTTPVKKAFRINSDKELIEETHKICMDLTEMGIHQNFAPVADLSPNATVSMRSFGSHPDTVIKYCR
ncbi:MAG: glycoside hydrolase family 3 N-terminal domain-containing protein, partial [Flavobacteriales bacterium]